jgi:hypothetical protein
MATYTVTRVITRPNTSTLWPEEHMAAAAGERVDGYVNIKSAGKLSVSFSETSDGLSQTGIFVWESKEEYIRNLPSGDNPDPTWLAARKVYNNYMVSAGITARTTAEDGTVRIFNSSNNMWELQE